MSTTSTASSARQRGLSRPSHPSTTFLLPIRTGRSWCEKASINVDKARLNLLLRKDRQTVIRMPSDKDRSLFMGIKLPDRLLFFDVEPGGARKLPQDVHHEDDHRERGEEAEYRGYHYLRRLGTHLPGLGQEVEGCVRHPEAPGFPLFPQLLHGDTRIQQARERYHQEDEREFHHAPASPRPRRGRRGFSSYSGSKEDMRSS